MRDVERNWAIKATLMSLPDRLSAIYSGQERYQ